MTKPGRLIPALLVFCVSMMQSRPASAAPASDKPLTYPPTRKVDQVDDYHGVKVADPYRWLEDADSPETADWVKAQNQVTFNYLRRLPRREALRGRLTQLWNHARYGVPFTEGGQYFYSKNDGLQNQAVLYTQSSLDAAPRVLLDPNTLSPDGTVALSGLAGSRDGKRMAYGLARAGSDWQEFHVRDVASGRDEAGVIRWAKFTGASWTKDGNGFFYSRYPEPIGEGQGLRAANRFHKVYYHALGTPQARDRLIYERPDEPEWLMHSHVSDDGRYALISLSKSGPHNRVYFVDLKDPRQPALDGPVVKLIDTFEASYDFLGNDGPVFYFRTDLDAPRGRIIAIDTTQPDRANWRTLLPERDDTLQDVVLVGDQFITEYLHNAYSQLRVVGMDGKPRHELELPTMGTVAGLRARREDTELFYGFTSYLHPPTTYRHDVTTGTSTVFRKPEVKFDPSAYETEQVFYRSKDGTRVPMFLTHRKGLKRNGNNPTYLTGYGGFNVSLTPSFSVSTTVWLEHGGILAVPNLRGGGEFGEAWHQAGTKEHKQNVFDDFIAAAEYLIREQYTSPKRLAIAGGSNGGLLVGAVLNQRPDLFAAAIPAVGVMDMLRFHRFTIGSAWTYDYGSSDDAEQFKAIHAYSPLHNVKPGTRYPATLVTTADHDDRVVPGHSFKYAAALQAAQAGPAPVLIRIETRAGHGAGKPTAKIIEEEADRWAFVMHHLGMDGE